MISDDFSDTILDYESVLNENIFEICIKLSRDIGFIDGRFRKKCLGKKRIDSFYLTNRIFSESGRFQSLRETLKKFYHITKDHIPEVKKYLKQLPEKISDDKDLIVFFHRMGIPKELQPIYLLVFSAFYYYLKKEKTMLSVKLLS